MRKISSTPASFAAASTSGLSAPPGAGTTIDDARHAGDLGRHRVHQHRGRIGRGAARHVEADRFDRGPARAELDAERVGEAIVLRQLAAVIGLDAVAGECERVERLAAAGRNRRSDLGGRHLHPDAVEIEPIEFGV